MILVGETRFFLRGGLNPFSSSHGFTFIEIFMNGNEKLLYLNSLESHFYVIIKFDIFT